METLASAAESLLLSRGGATVLTASLMEDLRKELVSHHALCRRGCVCACVRVCVCVLLLDLVNEPLPPCVCCDRRSSRAHGNAQRRTRRQARRRRSARRMFT